MKQKFKGLSVPEALFNRVKELSEKHKTAISRVTLALVEYSLKQVEEGHFELAVRPWNVLNASKAVPETTPDPIPTEPTPVEPEPRETIEMPPPGLTLLRKKKSVKKIA